MESCHLIVDDILHHRWVMWCSRHSAHVSSTYSLVSAVAGIGVAVAGASQVQWGWNGGKGAFYYRLLHCVDLPPCQHLD